MKPQTIILSIAAIGLLAAVTGILRPHSASTIGLAGTTGTSALHDMQSSSVAGTLPGEDIVDGALVFPREPKR